jgi:hypothetical protein
MREVESMSSLSKKRNCSKSSGGRRWASSTMSRTKRPLRARSARVVRSWGKRRLKEKAGSTLRLRSGQALEGKQDLGIEGGHPQMGVGQIDESVEVAVEGVGKGAQGGGFAGADVAGDEGRQAFLEGEGQAALDFAVTAGGVEVLAGDGTAERGLLEAIVVTERGHRSSPLHVERCQAMA